MRIVEEALTFDDVLLVPAFSEVLPKEVKLSTKLTRDIVLNIPMVSAAMDTVTEHRMAIAMAQQGGIGIIHKNMTVEEQAKEVIRVKKFESGVVTDPITVSPNISIREVMELTRQKKISGVPVVNGDDLVGIITSRDLRFETHLDAAVSSVMTPKERLVTVVEGTEKAKVLALLHEHRIEKILVVNDAFQLRGMITVKDMQKATDYPSACKDEQSRLRVGAAVGVGVGTDERVAALAEAGVDVLVVERQFLIDHYDVAKEVIENYARAAYEVRGDMPKLIEKDARKLGEKINSTESQKLAQGIQWKNTLENYAHFGVSDKSHALENIEDIILKITEVLDRTGALGRKSLSVPPNELYFNKIVQEMQTEKFHPGRNLNILQGVDLGDDSETVRGEQKLKPLTKAQWDSLMAVGELRMEPISFGRGTARINLKSRRELKALANTLNSWPQYYLTVTGRVRPGGDSTAALQLAKQRAEAAVGILVDAGVAPERIRSFSEVATENAAAAQSVSFVVGQLPY